MEKVEFLLVRAHYSNGRPIDRHFADHRREPEYRSPRNLEPQMSDIDKSGGAVALADVQLVDIQAQPIKIEPDFADANPPMNTSGDRPGHDVPEDRRHREIGSDS